MWCCWRGHLKTDVYDWVTALAACVKFREIISTGDSTKFLCAGGSAIWQPPTCSCGNDHSPSNRIPTCEGVLTMCVLLCWCWCSDCWLPGSWCYGRIQAAWCAEMFGGGNPWWKMMIGFWKWIGSAWLDWWCSIAGAPSHRILSAGILDIYSSLTTYSIYQVMHTWWGSVSNIFTFVSIAVGPREKLIDGWMYWVVLRMYAIVALSWCWSVHPWTNFVVRGCPAGRGCCWWVRYALPVLLEVWFFQWRWIFGNLMLELAGWQTGYQEHLEGPLSCLCQCSERSTLE